ncbi:MAG: hypothetical protein DI538_16135 [Azospira oryzae]|nr:MAG: hypothetical protein DI538_16135 [Azospira oryzae]
MERNDPHLNTLLIPRITPNTNLEVIHYGERFQRRYSLGFDYDNLKIEGQAKNTSTATILDYMTSISMTCIISVRLLYQEALFESQSE